MDHNQYMQSNESNLLYCIMIIQQYLSIKSTVHVYARYHTFTKMCHEALIFTQIWLFKLI